MKKHLRSIPAFLAMVAAFTACFGLWDHHGWPIGLLAVCVVIFMLEALSQLNTMVTLMKEPPQLTLVEVPRAMVAPVKRPTHAAPMETH